MPRKKNTKTAVDVAAPSVGVAEDVEFEEEADRILFERIKEFAHQRLNAAVDEIFEFFQNTVSDYEKNVEKYSRLLNCVLNPELKLHRIDGMVPSTRPPKSERQEDSSSEDDEEDKDREGDEDNDNVDEDEDDDDDEEASGGGAGDEGDTGEEDPESEAEPPEEDNEMDEEEVHEMKALQPELSMKQGEPKPRVPARTPEPREKKKKKKKGDAPELLGRLKLEVTTGAIDGRLRKTSICVRNVS